MKVSPISGATLRGIAGRHYVGGWVAAEIRLPETPEGDDMRLPSIEWREWHGLAFHTRDAAQRRQMRRISMHTHALPGQCHCTQQRRVDRHMRAVRIGHVKGQDHDAQPAARLPRATPRGTMFMVGSRVKSCTRVKGAPARDSQAKLSAAPGDPRVSVTAARLASASCA